MNKPTKLPDQNLSQYPEARIQEFFLLLIAVAGTIIVVIYSFLVPGRLMGFTLGIATVMVVALCQLLIRKGQLKLSGIIICLSIFMGIFLWMLFTGGVRSTAFGGFVLVVVVAGLLLDKKASFIFAGFGSLAGLGLCLLEINHILPQSTIPISSISIWITISFIFAIVATITFIIISNIENATHLVAEKQIALNDIEEKWNTLANAAPDKIINIDKDRKIKFINQLDPSMEPKTIGTKIESFVQEDYREHTVGQIESVLKHGLITSFDVPIIRAKGGVLWYACRISPVHQEEKVVGALVVATDVTEQREFAKERKLLEIQKRQSQRLESLGTLSSGVAHEINNPIQSIMNYAQLICHGKAISNQKDFAEQIINEAKRAAGIVSGLLTFSRQAVDPHFDTDIRDLIDRTLLLIRSVLHQDGISIIVEGLDELPTVLCSGQQIQQVFMNLLTNAQYALNKQYPAPNENKRIKIVGRKFERSGAPWLGVTIEDYGKGIEPCVAGRVFEPFFTTKEIDQGTGLGLAISHGIVTEHRGRLWAESRVGEFTRFHLELPADYRNASPCIDSKRESNQPTKTVSIIQDGD